MTQSKRLRRAWSSLRGPKPPGLLDPSGAPGIGPYDHLEETEPTWAAGGEKGAWQRVSPGKGDPRGGRGRRRSTGSLRVRRKAGQGGEEAGGAGGEAAIMPPAHPLGPLDDGQLLLGETDSQVARGMRKCKKAQLFSTALHPKESQQQVSRALQRGWETFMANVYSLTLSHPTSTARGSVKAKSHLDPPGAARTEAEPGLL